MPTAKASTREGFDDRASASPARPDRSIPVQVIAEKGFHTRRYSSNRRAISRKADPRGTLAAGQGRESQAPATRQTPAAGTALACSRK